MLTDLSSLHYMHTIWDTDLRNIKGILFDIDGTLYSQAPLRMIMAALLILLNCYKPKELFRKIKVIIQYRKAQEHLRSIDVQENGYESQIKYSAEKTGESTFYITSVVDEWFEKKPLPFLRLFRRRGVRKVFDSLCRKGVPLGVFSDYPVENKLHALGISKFVDTRISSSDTGVYGFKPKTNGFLVAAQKMGLDPYVILYVGDREDVDGVGASAAGMQVIIKKKLLKKRSYTSYPSFNSFHDLLKII